MATATFDEVSVVRPSLPPVLVGGLILWFTAALTWPQLEDADFSGLAGVCFGGVVLFGCGLVWCLRAHKINFTGLGMLCLGAALAVCGLQAINMNQRARLVESSESWFCVLLEDAKVADYGLRAKAQATADSGLSVKVRLSLPDNGRRYLCGDKIDLQGQFKEPSSSAASSYWDAGLCGMIIGDSIVSAESSVPLDFRKRALDIVQTYGDGESPLVEALVCGYRVSFNEQGGYDDFKNVGLAHLVAVSGAHLSLVTMFLAFGLRRMRVGPRLTAVITALFLGAYVLFTGMPVSALRAAIMAATGLVGLVVGRRKSGLAALGLCLFVFIAFDPPCAVSVSFCLSAASTLGILLFGGLIAQAFGDQGSPYRRYIGDPLALSAASALTTQPYAAALFSQIPILSPVANLVAGPLFTLGCVTGFISVVLALIIQPLAAPLITVACIAVKPLAAVVSLLGSFPGTCLPVDGNVTFAAFLSVIMCVVLWVWWPAIKPSTFAAATMATVLLVALPSIMQGKGDEIIMLDVGQGDAFLVRSQGQSLLIDTGNQDTLLKQACAREGITRLDAVAISHSDDDHCGSLSALGDIAIVDELLVAQALTTCACSSCSDLLDTAQHETYKDNIQGLSVGDRVECGRFSLLVVWPYEYSDAGGNADSLSFYVTWDGDGDGEAEWDGLFCGDAESDQISSMVSSLSQDGIDVLKVGHHGSKRSLTEELAKELSPEIALVGVGANNSYGHPTHEVLSLLDKVGCQTFRSDIHGDVIVSFSLDKLSVNTQKN